MNMNHTHKSSLLVALLAALATGASAQLPGAAVNAAGQAAGAARLTPTPVMPSVRPAPITPAPVSPRQPVAATASGAVNAAARAGVRAGATATGATNVHARGPEVRTGAGIGGKAGVDAARAGGVVDLNTKADANASVRGHERGLTVATVAAGGAAASVDADATVKSIEATAHGARGTLSAELQAKIEATAKAMADLRAEARALRGEARSNFDAAYAELRAKEKALRASLKDYVRESKEATWGEVQSRLAADYRAYAQAAARAESAANAGGTTGETPKS